MQVGCTQDTPETAQLTSVPPPVLSASVKNSRHQFERSKAQDPNRDSTNTMSCICRVVKDAPMYENSASQLSRPATDHHVETKIAIKSQTLSPQEIFVNRPAIPTSQSERLILSAPVLSLTAARRGSMAHPLAHARKKTAAESHVKTSPIEHSTVVGGLSPRYLWHMKGVPPLGLAVFNNADRGNNPFNNAEEVSISSTLVNRSGRRRKLTNQVNQYSSVRGMLLSLSDPLLSANELNRIKRYYTIDLNTDLIANFNCNLL